MEGRDIGDAEVLAVIAGSIGLDRDETAAALKTDHDKTEVQAEIATAVRIGVSGVPFFICRSHKGRRRGSPEQRGRESNRQEAARPSSAKVGEILAGVVGRARQR